VTKPSRDSAAPLNAAPSNTVPSSNTTPLSNTAISSTATKPTLRLTPRWLTPRQVKVLRQNKPAGAGLFIVIAFFLACVLAPLLTPPSGACLASLGGSEGTRLTVSQLTRAVLLAPSPCYVMPRSGLATQPTPPNATQLMGTVDGYDIFYGLLWGARSSLGLGFLIVCCSLLTGTVIGVIAGYFGGWLDNTLMRFTDLIYAFPSLVVSIVLVAVLGNGLVNVALSFMLVNWTLYARVVRAETLKVRALEYVEASRALGNNTVGVMIKHVLPNVAKPVIAIVVLNLGTIPLQLSALSFLGIGTPPGYADWGRLVSLAYPWIPGVPGNPFTYWYVSLFPGLAILLYSLGWNLLGDALQDALDVRSK
jgi:peptide/nickel transport system permease protein